MKYSKYLLLVTLFVLGVSLYAKPSKIDSLLRVLKTQQNDTDKINTLIALSGELRAAIKYDSALTCANSALALENKLMASSDPLIIKTCKRDICHTYSNIGMFYYAKQVYTKAIDFEKKAIKLADEIGDSDRKAIDYNSIGNVYADMADYTNGLDNYTKALKTAEGAHDKQTQADALGNIGLVYNYEGNNLTALDYYLKALKLAKDIGNKANIAADLGNIGLIYWNQGDSANALDYCGQAIKLNEEINDIDGLCNNLSNIGAIYIDTKNYKKGTSYLRRALELARGGKDRAMEGQILGNLGSIASDLHQNDSAIFYLTSALKIAKEVSDIGNYASNLGNIGGLYANMGRFKEGEVYLKRSIEMEDSLGDKNGLMHFESALSDLYDTTGRFELALKYYRKSIAIKDTLFNIEKNKALTGKEMNFKYEQKQAAEKAEQDKKNLIEEQARRRQLIIRNVFIVGFLLLLVFVFVVYKGYRDKKNDNIIITHQKELVEEKQKEILDSIHYAQRIQKALLASDNLLQKNLNDYFVLYKPKDIVSGDFYWATTKGNSFYLAICDSTGHGVPGAFMSLLNISFLNEAITEKGILQPGNVFDHARKKLIENISQDGQQDGMDGVLLCFDGKMNMAYAGAYNEPLIVRDGKVIELDADKIPVGKSPRENEPFTNHTFTLQKGDTVYVYTDGYADQFGGPKGKKFKRKQLLEKLLEISNRNMAEQRSVLDKTLNSWKEDLEQVDDILVIGIRV